MTNEQFEAYAARIPCAFTNGAYTEMYDLCSAAFREEVNAEEFCSYAADFHRDVTAYEPKPASTMMWGSIMRYVWIAEGGQKGLSVAFDVQGTIVGLRMTELTRYPETDRKKTKLAYRLPFRGEWLTYWGGTNELVNYHYVFPAQRYAFDFLQQKDGRSYAGDPLKNESYYAYGQPILAPAAGTVIRSVSSIPDNVPVGTINEEQPGGNLIVIDHGNGEFSLCAHLKYGTVTLQPGDHVADGNLIGLCGNSGNSSEPHLHFQVSDAPDLLEARSIRIRFREADDISQGQTVRG